MRAWQAQDIADIARHWATCARADLIDDLTDDRPLSRQWVLHLNVGIIEHLGQQMLVHLRGEHLGEPPGR